MPLSEEIIDFCTQSVDEVNKNMRQFFPQLKCWRQ